jgi:hypothetical protein
LHNEFKHIGPVPKEEQEEVWQRFKAASDLVYAKRDEFLVAGLQVELKQILMPNQKLQKKFRPFSSLLPIRIKDWNQKTQRNT